MDNLVLNLEINLKTIGTNSYGLQKEIRFCDLRNFFMFFIFQVKMGGNKAFYFLLKNRQIPHKLSNKRKMKIQAFPEIPS